MTRKRRTSRRWKPLILTLSLQRSLRSGGRSTRRAGNTCTPKDPTDALGDTKWIYDYYRAVDAMDMERTLAQHTDDTTLTFANHPTVHGKEGYKAAIGHLWGSIKGLSHSMVGAWSMHDGQVGVAEAIVQYTRSTTASSPSSSARRFAAAATRSPISAFTATRRRCSHRRSKPLKLQSQTRDERSTPWPSSLARNTFSDRLCRARSGRGARAL